MRSCNPAAAFGTPHLLVPRERRKMCKFSNHLFVFVLLCLGLKRQWTTATPIAVETKENSRSLSELLLEQDYDYDLHYDQRQKGNENLRLKLDGFLIGLPAERESSSLTLITDDILDSIAAEILSGSGKSGSTTNAPENSLNSFSKLEQAAATKQDFPFNRETIIVEIPASKKDREFESRQHKDIASSIDGGSRTKFHIIHLLNFLRGSKRI